MSAHLRRKIITAKQVGRYCVKRDTALMAASVVKEPDQASNTLAMAVTMAATYGACNDCVLLKHLVAYHLPPWMLPHEAHSKLQQS